MHSNFSFSLETTKTLLWLKEIINEISSLVYKAADMLSEGRGFGSHLSHVHILIWITPTLAACAFYVVNSPSPSPSVGSERVFLYTLPYDFNDFSYYDVTQSKFTYSNAIEYPVYDCVHALRHSFSDTLLMNDRRFT